MKKSQHGIIVCKFGGSSVASESETQRIKQILEENENRRIIVVSAPGRNQKYNIKVTDLLISAYTEPRKFDFYMHEVQKRFEELASAIGVSIDIKKEIGKIKRHFCIFKNRSYLLSRGEFLSAKIFALYLNAEFVDSAKLIKFNFSGKILHCTYKKIQTKLQKYEKVVIPGFYGANIFGKIKVMSRGGSDITGAILAKGLGSKIYENWTDVGYLESDYGNKAISKPIFNISYDDMRFLSFFGASILHYKASSLHFEGKTIIKNTFDSKSVGTIIQRKSRDLKFAHASRSAIEVEINDTAKVRKLFQNLHAEILYKQSIMGMLVVGFCTSDGYSNLKAQDKIFELSLRKRLVRVHAFVVSNGKQIDKVISNYSNSRMFCVGDHKFLIVEANP